MTTNAIEDVNAGTNGILRTQVAKGSTTEQKLPGASTGHGVVEAPVRLPRRIVGGFQGVGDDLDRRARDWRNVVRLLEQQRPQLETAEVESDRSHEALSRIVPEVQESNRILKGLLETTKAGDVSSDLTAQFNKSLAALDELESIAGSLTANLLWVRSTWEQYARTIILAQKMREDARGDMNDR